VGKVFVGIGFGPIQSGLFLLEAAASKNFDRLVIAEVLPEVVASVRKGGGRIRINVAHDEGIVTREIEGIEIFNPLDPEDAARLVEVIAVADEIATALPSVDFYDRGDLGPSALLARGLQRKLAQPHSPNCVVYTAENDNHAAEKLEQAVLARVDRAADFYLKAQVAFLNTVIGKMSGTVVDRGQIERDALVPIVDDGNTAVLVEQFNRILISAIPLPDFRRGIEVFEEKSDLLPFEEAKLYGHNAAHALLGFMAERAGLTYVSGADASLLQFVEHAFREESGLALCRRHAGVDRLFTREVWSEYVQDLMKRMVNPYLRDRVNRITRDPRRKLAWNDRLIGTMRLALEQGIEPQNFAVGAAAATEVLLSETTGQSMQSLLSNLWRAQNPSDAESRIVIEHISKSAI
jgi:mannitol-1-phosphate 5-dehydrogenase